MLTPETLKSLASDPVHAGKAQMGVPAYDRAAVTPGIVHFGVGNFFRAHLANYVDRVLSLPENASDPQARQWGIIGVGLRESPRALRKAEDFVAQDGLYSLTEAATGGARDIRVLGALKGYLLAPREGEKVLALLASPATRIVSLTITEGGYNIDETPGPNRGKFRLKTRAVAEDLADPGHPKTVFGFVAEGMRRRRAAGLSGVTILSCDNLRHNGDVSRKAFLGYAQALDPELAAWMEANCTFPNAMVDRITPSVSQETMDRLNARSGLQDLQPLLAEDFTQWVVEDKFAAGRPPFEKVGVQFSDQVSAFEHAKIRMLNCSHLILSAAGMLMGVDLVHDVLAYPQLRRFVDDVLDRDVIPTLQAPPGVDLVAYKDTILTRFANKAMADQVARIAADATSKAQVFWTETVRSVLENPDHDPSRIITMQALLLELLRGRREDGTLFELEEPALDEAQLEIAHYEGLDESPDKEREVFTLPAFDSWRDLMTPELEDRISRERRRLRRLGVLEALAAPSA
ncbi:mannitol dehydrogenase family protein [Oecophyllibacter saccharovorans]|uniref:mannitol dehydrogenase family protein n=1 Tax=Oecophyllibacter saccharovorans TaxID=2558360 RepID=UPI001172EA0F|nr:mannitol dehydrogenase family protein [Oecophyllibacter saccharovorans]TPW35249.1 mannitol dehydrogenase family protein [Oecophyllibacter saccharovorans]